MYVMMESLWYTSSRKFGGCWVTAGQRFHIGDIDVDELRDETLTFVSA